MCNQVSGTLLLVFRSGLLRIFTRLQALISSCNLLSVAFFMIFPFHLCKSNSNHDGGENDHTDMRASHVEQSVEATTSCASDCVRCQEKPTWLIDDILGLQQSICQTLGAKQRRTCDGARTCYLEGSRTQRIASRDCETCKEAYDSA